MLAHRLWVIICLELAALAALARWWFDTGNPLLPVGFALGVHVLARLLFAFNTLTLAGVWRAAPDLGLLRALRVLFAEAGAMLAHHSLLIPLQRWLVPRDPRPHERVGQPVLLIHGYFCARGVWWSLRRYLRRNGLRNIYTLDLEPIFGNIDDYVRQLDTRIGEIASDQPGARLLLIAHSMGGLVATRHAAVSPRRSIVSGLVNLGTPHHGTDMARLAPGTNGRQMRPGSRWLARYHAEAPGSGLPALTNLYSTHDNIVAPQDNAQLAGAENIRLIGVGHMEMLFAEGFQRLVLERARANNIENGGSSD